MKAGPENIKISDYHYDLPDERIARYPLPERDASKLIYFDGRHISDHIFRDLPSLLQHDDLLVFNNTRVIRARLRFRKDTGATVEIFCLEPLAPADFAQSLACGPGVEWKCLVGNLKRWKGGILSTRFSIPDKVLTISAEVTGNEGDTFNIRFNWDDENISFADVLEMAGHIPIPPYLGRDDEESDNSRYQTTYAKVKGSVAAPTAGLHFTGDIIRALKTRGISTAEVTLHVSAGTFRPVKSETISGHRMHREHFFVTREVLERMRVNSIVAVGTTTVRTLESIYWLGASIASGNEPDSPVPSVSQWTPYDNPQTASRDEAINSLLGWMDKKRMKNLEATTDIIIVPGYTFRVIRGIVTNFHQPGSTLLLLVAAFAGGNWKEIYEHAISSGYRFLSYGDSMFLHPNH